MKSNRPKIDTMSQVIRFRVSNSLMKRFEAIAAQDRRRICDLARIVLEDWIVAQDQQAAPAASPTASAATPRRKPVTQKEMDSAIAAARAALKTPAPAPRE